MAKRKILVFLFLCFLSIFSPLLWSQFISDPNDRLYSYITLWYEKGYINECPIIRPYPLQVIKALLKEVIRNGQSYDIETAEKYQKYIFGMAEQEKPDRETFKGLVHGTSGFKFISDMSDYYYNLELLCTMNGFIGNIFSYSGKLAVSLFNEPADEPYPVYTNLDEDFKTGGGILELGEAEAHIGQLGIAGFSFGTDKLFIRTGLSRSSFGPFFDNSAVIGSHCPSAGNLSFLYSTEWITFSSVYMDLIPKYQENPKTGDKELIAVAETPAYKYLILHSIVLTPFSWGKLGIIQSIIGGKKFNIAYLIPLQHLFYTQQLYGDYESSFLGLFTCLRFPFDLQSNILFYVDDWDSFSSSEKQPGNFLNLDSAQNKFALQIGLNWTPDFNIFRRIGVEYLMITPYTYSHYSMSHIPYLSYTHLGYNLGSILHPNSDQLSLNVFITPLNWIDLSLRAKYIRHGNASEDFSHGDGAGTVYDDGFVYDEVTFYSPSRFLTQNILERVLKLELATDAFLAFNWSTFKLSFGYIFEHIWNKDLVQNNNIIRNIFFCNLNIQI